MEISMSDLRANLPKYLDLVEQGVSITVTRHGRPSALLEPVAQKPLIDTEKLRRRLAKQSHFLTENPVVTMREEAEH